MKLGKIRIFIFTIFFFIGNSTLLFAVDKIESVPLINLEELSPTFEEDKDELEKIEKNSINTDDNESFLEKSKNEKNDKIYINLKALDKITAKSKRIKINFCSLIIQQAISFSK